MSSICHIGNLNAQQLQQQQIKAFFPSGLPIGHSPHGETDWIVQWPKAEPLPPLQQSTAIHLSHDK